MMSSLAEAGAATFLVFCRIGACLMLVPAFSSIRVPARFRLYLAFGISIAIVPAASLTIPVVQQDDLRMVLIILTEVAIGLMYGFLIRVMFLALEIVTEFISMCIGLTNTFGVGTDSNDSVPTLTAFVSICAVTLMLLLDLHHKVIIGLATTYKVVPLGDFASIGGSLKDTLSGVGLSFVAALRIAGPFILYSVTVNFAFGIMNKIIPQFPAYFVSLPFVIIGGLSVLYLTIGPGLQLFLSVFSSWLAFI